MNMDVAEPASMCATDENQSTRQLTELQNSPERNFKDIAVHIEHNVGPPSYVHHDLQCEQSPIAIHVIEPCDEQPFYTLITSGMSDRPMNVPAGMEMIAHTELVLHLAPNWPIGAEAFKDENNYWPIRWLLHLARLPHLHSTWLWLYHAIPNGEPPQPFASRTGFNSIMMIPPRRLGRDFYCLNSPKGYPIYFLCLCPLYDDEYLYQQTHGHEAFMELIAVQPSGIEIVDNLRRDVCGQLIWK